MKKSLLLIASLAFCCTAAHATLATDVASNYAGDINGQNGGVGFLAWAVTHNNNGSTLFAGNDQGDSTAGAGDINTAGASFYLYANPGSAFINADRGFSSALSVGETFSFQMGLNYDNGNKGFNLFAGAQGEVFNFNLGGGAGVSSANASINPSAAVSYDYGGNNAVFDVSLSVDSATTISYDISRTSESGLQGTLFAGTVSGLTESISGFRFYNSGTDNGDAQNNIYFNSLSVSAVPEPSTWLLFGLGSFALMIHQRKRG